MVRYKYSILLVSTFVLAFVVGHFGYLDAVAFSLSRVHAGVYAFIAGAMYSFSFTAGFAVVLFSNLSISQSSVITFSLISALGGLLADMLIFRFIKDVLFNELGTHAHALIAKATRKKITKILLSVFGAIIIASPFPDEIGLAFMGFSKISFWKLVVLTYCLDCIGTYLIISAVAQIY